MLEFLQAYGGWILIGVVFMLMMRAHGGGMGCGMGHGGHQGHDESGRGRRPPSVDEKVEETKAAEREPVAGGRHRGC